jgi:hypothetical protein
MQIGNISCAVKIPLQKKEDIMAFSHTVIALSCVSNIEHIPKLVGILPEEEIIFMTIIPGISLQNLSTLDTYFSNRSILQICRLIQSVHAQKLELDN